jgi:DNA-directed RNA polymerase II subunit RPB2
MNPFTVVKENGSHEVQMFIGGIDSNDIYFSKTRHLPNECRLKDATYECDLIANITIICKDRFKKTEHIKELKHVTLCKIPIMLHSCLCKLKKQPEKVLLSMGECPYDKGGYFIVDGKEKVIVSQERNVTNKLFIGKPANPDKHKHQAFIKCTSDTDSSVFPKTLWLYVDKHDRVKVKIPHVSSEIPLFILFRALGVESDKNIIHHILQGNDMSPKFEAIISRSVTDANSIFLQKDALDYIAPDTAFKTVQNLLYILFEDFLPNVPFDMLSKAKYLGSLAMQLIDVALEIKSYSDRDNYTFKRVGVSGFLLGDIFKDFYNNFRVATRIKVDNMYEKSKPVENLQSIINIDNKNTVFSQSIIFQNGLVKSLKGKWGLLKQEGIVQDLSRISFMGFMSHLRRVNSGVDPSVKIRKPHQLTGSQWGIMCPCESPDGAGIGLIKNLAVLCTISSHISIDVIHDALNAVNLSIATLEKIHLNKENANVFMNNNWIGQSDDPKTVYQYLKLLKKNGFINSLISISWNVLDNAIFICTDGGRCCRPLIVVEPDGKMRKRHGKVWNDFVAPRYPFHNTFIDPISFYGDMSLRRLLKRLQNDAGFIEYIDVLEASFSHVAMSQELVDVGHTHCEVHPSTIFSAYTSTVPFANHNQAPRNIFSGAQGKQAIGVYATNFNSRIDTMSYVLHYPQKPIISTTYMKYLNADKLPNGENLIVAISTYGGYNQEDSIILNKSSVDRGMFNVTYFKSYRAEEKIVKDTGDGSSSHQYFGNPILNRKDIQIKKFANYTKIDADGMPKLNEFIEDGDCIVGRVTKNLRVIATGDAKNDVFVKTENDVKFKSGCMIADKTISGFVDKIAMFEKEGVHSVKIRLRKVRIPELGDKMASRHGQKGVVGMVYTQEMMPFTQHGLVPDIIINPHALPTRMTIGHLLECVLAKSFVCSGKMKTFTPFNDVEPERIKDQLQKLKFNRNGDEIMYNGVTGEQMQCEIFIGPTYYFRLKHMVADKINSRTAGQVVGLTHQPPKGRGNDGGLRIGEMETNVLISHGISAFAKESVMERSDKYTVVVNNNGVIIPYNVKKKIVPERGFTINVPYSFKLMMQELSSLSLNTRLMFSEYYDDIDDFGEFDD